MDKLTLHIIPNAHLDPVWLWDRREGLNEGLRTCATMVRLMDRHPDLTFNRGEAAIYSHVARYDKGLFARIGELVREGRWCIVGGNWIQQDQNMPGTADMLKPVATLKQGTEIMIAEICGNIFYCSDPALCDPLESLLVKRHV